MAPIEEILTISNEYIQTVPEFERCRALFCDWYCRTNAFPSSAASSRLAWRDKNGDRPGLFWSEYFDDEEDEDELKKPGRGIISA